MSTKNASNCFSINKQVNRHAFVLSTNKDTSTFTSLIDTEPTIYHDLPMPPNSSPSAAKTIVSTGVKTKALRPKSRNTRCEPSLQDITPLAVALPDKERATRRSVKSYGKSLKRTRTQATTHSSATVDSDYNLRSNKRQRRGASKDDSNARVTTESGLSSSGSSESIAQDECRNFNFDRAETRVARASDGRHNYV